MRTAAKPPELEWVDSSLAANLPGMFYGYRAAATPELLFASSAIETLTGWPPADFLSGKRSWRDLAHPADAPRVRAALEHGLATGRFRAEYRIAARDGERWVLEQGWAVRGPGGAIDHMEGYVEDVTARHAAEDLLRRSEERYRTLVAATSGFVWSALPDGMVQDIPGWRAVTGQTIEEVAGRGWLNAIHPDDQARVAATWDAAERSGGLYKVEYRVRRKEGGWTHLEVRGVPVREPDGTIREWVGTCTIIDDRKAAEDALRESEARFRNMAGNAPVILWITDENGLCTYVNEPWERTTGIPVADALGDGWVKALHPDDADRVAAAFAKVTAERGEWNVEYRLRHRDGTHRWSNAAAVPRFGGDGRFLGYIGSLVDIEDRRRAEEVLRAEKERLERLDRSKNQFLNLVAHELRTPMTPILMQLRMMRDSAAPGERRRVEILERNMDRLNSLVQQLLDVARLESGRLPLRRETQDIRPLVAEVHEMYVPAAREAGVTLATRCPEPVPASVDAHRLLQVAINLVSNALKMTPAGGTVLVEAGAEGGDAVLRVADTGRGLDADQLARLFQPFSQVHADARNGTGLGLYITRTIVEAHGGTIDAASQGPGRGVTFTVRLPLARAAAPTPEPRRSPRAPGAAALVARSHA